MPFAWLRPKRNSMANHRNPTLDLVLMEMWFPSPHKGIDLDAHVFAYAFFGNLCQSAIDRKPHQKKKGGTPGVIRSLELDLIPPDRVSMQGKNGPCKQRSVSADANTSII